MDPNTNVPHSATIQVIETDDKGRTTLYDYLHQGQNRTVVLSQTQKDTFIGMKVMGWGDAHACKELHTTLNTLYNTFRADPAFAHLAHTYSQCLVDECEEVLFNEGKRNYRAAQLF